MRIASAALLLAGCAGGAVDPGLAEIGAGYSSYGRVDDVQRLAPTMCKLPTPAPPRLSASRDPETHGRKLYYLYAKHQEAYRICRELDQPVGQVLVKESWVPGKPLTRGPLFAMVKTGEADSDAGWIYATLTPDGKTVTASGKIASCMECHQSERTRDRLFGVTSCAAAK
jgi:hypothetical protein